MWTCRHRWSHCVGRRRTSAVSPAMCCYACRSPYHPHPHHTALHLASSPTTSAVHTTATVRRLQPGILQKRTASHPIHHQTTRTTCLRQGRRHGGV